MLPGAGLQGPGGFGLLSHHLLPTFGFSLSAPPHPTPRVPLGLPVIARLDHQAESSCLSPVEPPRSGNNLIYCGNAVVDHPTDVVSANEMVYFGGRFLVSVLNVADWTLGQGGLLPHQVDKPGWPLGVDVGRWGRQPGAEGRGDSSVRAPWD